MTLTWEDFMKHISDLEMASKVPEGVWYMYVHPAYLKHHPTVRYLRRYHRRGERILKAKEKPVRRK